MPLDFSYARATGIVLLLAALAVAGCTLDFDRFAPRSELTAEGGPGPVPDGGSIAMDAGASIPPAEASTTTDSGSASDGAMNDAATSGGRDAGVEGGAPCTEPRAVTFGGHCYFPTTTRTSWTASNMGCQAAGAHLVTITSAGEQAAVAPLSSNQDRWIGMNRPVLSLTANSYVWLTGEPVAYTNWAQGEPNFSGECVRIQTSGTWADNQCTNSAYAICERD
jgi:hypothetical protein